MAIVSVIPMPGSYRDIPSRLRPCAPPVFHDGDPKPADIALAKDLFAALDPASKAWYRASMPALFANCD